MLPTLTHLLCTLLPPFYQCPTTLAFLSSLLFYTFCICCSLLEIPFSTPSLPGKCPFILLNTFRLRLSLHLPISASPTMHSLKHGWNRLSLYLISIACKHTCKAVFIISHPGYLRVGLQDIITILKSKEYVLFIFYILRAQESIPLI